MLIDEEFDEQQQQQLAMHKKQCRCCFMFLWEVTISQDDDGRLARNNSPILTRVFIVHEASSCVTTIVYIGT